MSTLWKFACIVALLMAVAALGISIGVLRGVAPEAPTARADEPVYVDLSKVMLQYNDPMRNMDGMITYRQVFQDALWWQIMDPHVSEDVRAECFGMAGILSEGRGTEITQAQYDILMGAVQQVWGPAVVAAIEEELQ